MISAATNSADDDGSPLPRFRDEVEAFLIETEMAPRRFGKDACNDSSFVFDLREGRREPRWSTMETVREFMRRCRAGRAAAE